MFTKQPKLQFWSIIPGLDKVMPIIQAKELVHEWKKETAKEFQEMKKLRLGETLRTMSYCPGINTITKYGYIIRAYQDFYINPTGMDSFEWRTPIDQTKMTSGLSSVPQANEDYVGYHHADKFKHFKNWPNNTLRCLLKINTGWRVIVPKGYVLYQLPVFHNDENRFTAAGGAYTRDHGLAAINLPLFWHSIDRPEVVKAGTPLAHLILAPQIDYEFEMLDKPNHEFEQVFSLATENRFVRDYAKIKQFFNPK